MSVGPLSYNIEEYNGLSKSIEVKEGKSEELQTKLGVIDKIMREVIETELQITKQIRTGLGKYMALKPESRSWRAFTEEIACAFSQNKVSQLKNLEQVFEARKWCVQKGKVVPLTQDIKVKLLSDLSQAFDKAQTKYMPILSQEITCNNAIFNYITTLGTRIEELNRLNEHQFNTKISLTMKVHEANKEAESLMQTRNQLQEGDATSLESICQRGDIARLSAAIAQIPSEQARNTFVNTAIKGTPLIIIAAISGQSAIVIHLLENGANIESCDECGYQAIHYAAKEGNENLTQLLLQRNPHIVNARGEYGRTPLHMAAFHGKEGVVKLLLDRGANPNLATEESDHQKTPLHNAVIQNKSAVVMELLKRRDRDDNLKCDVNLRCQGHQTPLRLAVEDGLLDIVCLILPYHQVEDPNDDNSITKLLTVESKQNNEMIRSILQDLMKG